MNNLQRTLLLAVALLLLATPMLYGMEHWQEFGQDPQQRRAQYEATRMKVITQLAPFTQMEKEFVAQELQKYDRERFKAWEESWKIRQELHNAGDNVTPERYSSSLKRLLELDDIRQEAKLKLFQELNKRLTPKQSYAVYIGMKGNNARTGKDLREAK